MIAVGWAVSGGLATAEELDRGAEVLDGREAEDGFRREWLGAAAAGVDMIVSACERCEETALVVVETVCIRV